MNSLLFQKRLSSTEYLLEQCNAGVMSAKFSTRELQQIREGFPSRERCLQTRKAFSMNLKNRTTFMQEYLHENNQVTLTDKSLCWLSASPDISLLQTLDPALTSRGRAFYPFWNAQRRGLYDKLWLPLKTDCVDFPMNCLNGSSNSTLSNCWFKNNQIGPRKPNYQMTSFPSSMCLVANKWDAEDTKKMMSCRKIKIYPDHQARTVLKTWTHLYRHCYNKAVYLNKPDIEAPCNRKNQCNAIPEAEPHYKQDFPFRLGYDIRNLIKSDCQTAFTPWLKKLPTELREGAANDFSSNYQASITNFQRGFSPRIGLPQYRRKSDSCWTLKGFQKRSLKRKDAYSFRLLPKYCDGLFKSSEKLPDIISNDFSLHFDGIDYFILLPREDSKDIEIEEDAKRKITSVDPGIRTFNTTYSPTGNCFEYGMESGKRLLDLEMRKKAYQKKIKKRIGRNRKVRQRLVRKYTFRALKLKKKIANLVDDLHYKTIKHMLVDTKCILIPKLKVQRIKNLNKKSKREGILLRHGQFVERLKTKALKTNCLVMIVGEQYTTQQCNHCGWLNRNIGSNKTFTCQECFIEIDRDVHSARGVLVKSLRDFS